MDTLQVAQMAVQEALGIYGCGNAQAAGCHEGGIGVGVRGRECDEEMSRLVDEAESDL